MDIRIIDDARKDDINIPNEPFSVFGRMTPTYICGKWGYDISYFSDDEITDMCFPNENYDYEKMKTNHVFIGAYEDGKCVGLAILQDAFFKYMYLYDLKVSMKYRKNGVGAALIRKAHEVCALRGYRGIYTIGQDNNLAACLFYLKSGFVIGGLDTNVYKHTSQEEKSDILFYSDGQG